MLRRIVPVVAAVIALSISGATSSQAAQGYRVKVKFPWLASQTTPHAPVTRDNITMKRGVVGSRTHHPDFMWLPRSSATGTSNAHVKVFSGRTE